MDTRALDPQQVLDLLDAIGLRGDGRVLQLNSYENRVFQVFLEDGTAVVAKFYRPGRWTDAQILEEHAFALELAAAEVPVVAPLSLTLASASALRSALVAAGSAPGLRVLGDAATLACAPPEGGWLRCAVAPRRAGREPELEDPKVLEQLGRFIGRLHAVGRLRPFVHRHHLDPRADGRRALTLLIDGGFVPDTERPAWTDACQRALDAVEAAFEAAAPVVSLRLHGDCHPGNLLWRDAAMAASDPASSSGLHVVDLDDAMQGPAVQDLWMLVSGDASTMAAQFNHLLRGYEQFCDFDDRERLLIEPLRTLRMLRHSAWLADRWTDPTFPINFPFFGSAAYWSQQTAQLREQSGLMAAVQDRRSFRS